MFGFPTATLLANAWTAFSLAGLFAGAGGLGLLALAFLGSAWLPALVRRSLLGLGLVVGAAIYQAGTAKGAHDAFAVAAAGAQAAETIRADRAEATIRDMRAQAAQDAAAQAADDQLIRELTDALAKRPDRDRIALPHDLSRRLRNLRDGTR